MMKMKTLAIAFTLLASTAAHAQKRVISHEDVWLMHRVGDPVLSPDGKHAVFSVTEPSYDSDATVSDLWIVPTDGSAKPRRLTGSKGAESRAVFSPDGRSLAFTAKRDGDEADQVYLLPLDGGEARRITSLPSGASSPQFRPDGKAILFQTMIWSGARSVEEHVQRADREKKRKDTARAYDTFPVRFWNFYLDGREPAIVVQELDAAPPALISIAPLRGSFNPTGGGESVNPVWTPDGTGVVFQATANRDRAMYEETETSLYLVPASGGSPRRLTPEGASFTSPRFSPDGRSLYALESRSSTAKQIYFVTRLARIAAPDWKTVSIVTTGWAGWDRSVGGFTVSPDGRSLYIEAEDDGTVKVFRIPSEGGAPEVVYTPQSGGLSALEAAADVIVAKHSAAIDPGQIVRLNPASKSFTPLTELNKARLAELQLPAPEHFWFTAKNGKRIHSVLVPPPSIEAGKKYPILVNPHGGPNSMSADAFSLRWNYHLLTSPGYYLLMTNYTGSTGFGEKFTDDIERDVLRGPALEILEAVEEAAKKHPQIDTSRQAAVGASYGGYLMNWFNSTTTQFKCLVNHAGAVNNESQYGVNDGGLGRELRMGAPIWETGKGQWFDQSPIRYSNVWKTPMLITQGELDYRVPLSESMTTFKLLQRLKVPTRLILFPDEGHWILKGPNSRRHMEEVLTWLKTYLEVSGTTN
jgi:dipeptidyl aminopeptidase/acylaminoacyl peptidase